MVQESDESVARRCVPDGGMKGGFMPEEQSGDPQREMPRYSCHKTVHALKIAAILIFTAIITGTEIKTGQEARDGAIITPSEEGYAPFRVDEVYMRKHNPQVGGYYVVYKGGYKSFSPAEAFEGGYTRITG